MLVMARYGKIQQAPGHASSKTTENYTRASRTNIKKMPNLLDDLKT
jgi:hypothetical protein